MTKLHDIFTTRKKKTQTPKFALPKITIDHREKNSLVPARLIKLGFETEFKELKIGDYIVRDVIIERKTISDFLSSMCNKRLLNQIEELKQFENKLLIIEGIEEQDLYSGRNKINVDIPQDLFCMQKEKKKNKFQNKNPSKMNPNSVRGFLLSIALRHKIPILFTKNPRDTAEFISLIAKKQQREMSINHTKKARNKKEQMQFILECFPGIGPKNARKLLKKFSTLQNIFSAPQDELQKVIGKKAEIFMLLEEGY